MFNVLALDSLQIIVFMGAIQNIVSKAAKYEFFEPAKELSYIAVDEELRTKGKAFIEVIGARLGKSTGAVIQWVLLSLFTSTTLLDLTPLLLALCLLTLVFWIYGTFRLDKAIKHYTKGNVS
jgi:AAA family ATP:ADP antiporter